MHKRSFEEMALGRYIVIFDGNMERFFKEADAKEYCKQLTDNGINAYIHHVTSDAEDDNIGYYCE